MSRAQNEQMEVDDQAMGSRKKIFNDPVHGSMEFDPLLVKIIDTPQFQRLRNIKQLGGAYYVYPGASHNRFEHSLGVAYLAGEITTSLRRKQPELGITDADILNVQIAGLCHDLGHGPFSHAFDMYFIPQVLGRKIKHEDLSIKMFDHLIKENGLKGEIEEEDIYLIKDLINPIDVEAEQMKTEYVQKIVAMRETYRDKRFLWDIISNKHNGLDVDKWDYFARDCLHLGLKNSFDHWRFIAQVRAIKVDSERQICYPDKEIGNVYDMFYTRNTLHRRAYKHRVTKIIEHMILEALVIANDHLRIFQNSAGKKLTMSECVDDMQAYTLLTDSVLDHIMCSDLPQLEGAKEILRKVQKRDLYKHIGKTTPITDPAKIKQLREKEKDKRAVCEEILASRGRGHGGEAPSSLTADDLVFNVMKMDYGKGESDPVKSVHFYSKDDQTPARTINREEVSEMLPHCFLEAYVHLHCKKTDQESIDRARESFKAWCTVNVLTPKTDDASRRVVATPDVVKLKEEERQRLKRQHADTRDDSGTSGPTIKNVSRKLVKQMESGNDGKI